MPLVREDGVRWSLVASSVISYRKDQSQMFERIDNFVPQKI